MKMPSKHEMERRVAGGNITSTDPTTITGYASVCGVPYPVGEFVEMIGEDAFDMVMTGNPDIRLLLNHDANYVLARTKSGTLTVTSNTKGLYFSGKIAPTQVGRDTLALVARKDIAECSFSFSVGDGMDTWEKKTDTRGNPYVLRTINNFKDIYDVSVVTYPASSATSCDARNILPDAVLLEARSHGARQGNIFMPRPAVELVTPAERQEILDQQRREKYHAGVEAWRKNGF
jgi:HK97 family phage prohead protease